jgi:hypothetical protein
VFVIGCRPWTSSPSCTPTMCCQQPGARTGWVRRRPTSLRTSGHRQRSPRDTLSGCRVAPRLARRRLQARGPQVGHTHVHTHAHAHTLVCVNVCTYTRTCTYISVC